MTKEKVDDNPAEEDPAAADASEGKSSTPEAADAVRTGARVITALILVSLTWYLFSDRFTPYTSQARVQGYVVGVAPKVAGVVTHVAVNNNEAVEKDQTLFQIDPSQYEIALAKARSDLEGARRQVGAGSASVDSARANLLAAEANRDKADKNASRLERLHAEDAGTISTRQLEVARANLDAARAQVTVAEAGIQAAIEQMGGDDDENNNIVKTAQTAVEKAELDVANTTVKASAAGIITDLSADVGRYAGTGTAVMTLVATRDVWINAEFTENNLGHLRVGTPVEILFDVLPGAVYEGKVRSIGLGVDAGQATTPGTLPTVDNDRDWLRQSQRFPVIVEFAAGNEPLRGQLRVGGQASVIAYTEGHEFLALLGKAYIRLMSWLSYAY